MKEEEKKVECVNSSTKKNGEDDGMMAGLEGLKKKKQQCDVIVFFFHSFSLHHHAFCFCWLLFLSPKSRYTFTHAVRYTFLWYSGEYWLAHLLCVRVFVCSNSFFKKQVTKRRVMTGLLLAEDNSMHAKRIHFIIIG